ncbi:MAG: SDR family oxidoreductase [Acidimicrobiia bacterium]
MSEQPAQCVIVGATGTMGSVVARKLAERGLRVVAVARNEDGLKELAAGNDLITPCPADIADNSSIEAIKSHLDGTVKMAVFAAGLPVRGSADTIDPDALAVGANIKVGGLVRLLHGVRDNLEASSRFVTFAGSLGLEPRAHEAGPGAINAAVFNLMRQVSMLYGPKGVTTHTIAPGPADTPRLRRIVTAVAEEQGRSFDEVWQGYLDQTSLGRLPTPDEIAWAVMMLLEPEADILHGGVLNLDAGTLRGIY